MAPLAQSRTEAWAIDNIKNALLFYDVVTVPDFLRIFSSDFGELSNYLEGKQPVRDLECAVEYEGGIWIANDIIAKMVTAAVEKLSSELGQELPAPRWPAWVVGDPPHVQRAFEHLEQIQTAHFCGVIPQDILYFSGNRELPYDGSLVTLTGFRLVDNSTLSFEHLEDIRKDRSRRQKLGRFVRMMHKDFDGWEIPKIEDEILGRVEDYEETARYLGLNLVDATIKDFCGGKIPAYVAALAGVSVVGNPVLTLGATAPLIFEFGKMVFEFRGARRAMRKRLSDDPIAFLADARRHGERAN